MEMTTLGCSNCGSINNLIHHNFSALLQVFLWRQSVKASTENMQLAIT